MPRSYKPISVLPLNSQIFPLIFLTTLFSILTSSFSLPNKPNFNPDLVLTGDAKFTNDDVSIQLTCPKPSSPSSGFLFQKKPIKFLTSKSRKPLSFSTDFTFTISPHNGNGLAFVIVPRTLLSKITNHGIWGLNEKRFLGVEFGTLGNESHVGVNVGSIVSVNTSNLTGFVLNSGVKLRSWVDYDSSSKRIEVRLSESGNVGPYNPLLVYQIDLGEMWRNEEVFVGLSSSSGDSMQTCSLYSWQFRTRSVPKGLHSQPLDPQAFSRDHGEEKLAWKKRNCVLGLVSGLVFFAGWGVLLALVVVILWAVFENRLETVLTIPTKCIVHSEGFRYEKVDVVVGDESDDLKK